MKKISIGEHLRTTRLARKTSLEQASEELEIPMQYITVMEHNQFKFLDEEKIETYLTSYASYLQLDSQQVLEGYQAPGFEIEVEETEAERLAREKAEEERERSKPKKKWLRSMRFDYVKDPNRKFPLFILVSLTLLIVGLIGWAVYYELDQEAKQAAIPSSSLKEGSQATPAASNSSQAILTTSVKDSHMYVKLAQTDQAVTVEVSQDSDADNLVRITNSDLAKRGSLLTGETKTLTASVKSSVKKVVIMVSRVDKTTIKINGQSLDLSGLKQDGAGYITLTIN